mmetsp:Transcript_15166/g.32950  ORF Transcript_15166/g.32950 Transcript_15166/m.32950 type:complete len:156 (-) Transcript_15166:69-536(-)
MVVLGEWVDLAVMALVLSMLLWKFVGIRLNKPLMVSVDALMEQHHADLVTLVKRKYEATEIRGFVLLTSETMTKLAACCKHKFDEEKVYDYFGAKEIDKICGKLYRPSQMAQVKSILESYDARSSYVLVLCFPTFPIYTSVVPFVVEDANAKKEQ